MQFSVKVSCKAEIVKVHGTHAQVISGVLHVYDGVTLVAAFADFSYFIRGKATS